MRISGILKLAHVFHCIEVNFNLALIVVISRCSAKWNNRRVPIELRKWIYSWETYKKACNKFIFPYSQKRLCCGFGVS